jgi:hypothetical protein
MFMLEVILTPVCMKEGRIFLYHFTALQTDASQAVVALSVGVSLLLIWVILLHIKIGKYVPLLFSKFYVTFIVRYSCTAFPSTC